jgi:hypothetical protein
MPADIQNLITRHSGLKADRAPWESLWQDVARYVIPRKAWINTTTMSPNLQNEERLFDNTATLAALKLAGAFVAWLTPAGSPWFAIKPPRPFTQSDRAMRWASECTELMREYLAKSNFYGVMHESALDVVALGTTPVYCGHRANIAPFEFQSPATGTYCLEAGGMDGVTGLWMEDQKTAMQLRDIYGEGVLPPRVLLALVDEKRRNEKFKLVQAIFPREGRDVNKADAVNMPFASVHFLPDEQAILRETGYEEQPFVAQRYLLWPMGGHTPVYGYSPSWVALPESRQLNFLQMMSDALAEKMAFPPILVHEQFEGRVDSRARGVTYFKDGDSKPEEWQTSGRIDAAMERMAERKKAIREAFHLDTLNMFADLDAGKMTATEIMARKEEKITNIDPTFSRAMTEKIDPLLNRAFSVALRNGWLPLPPPEMLATDSSGQGVIPPPEFQFSNRFVLAQQATHVSGFLRTVDWAMGMAQFQPDILDNFNFDKAARDIARVEGTTPEWIRDEEERDATRQARAEQQAAAMQAEQAAMAADAAGKLGKVPADSPVAKAIASQLPV